MFRAQHQAPATIIRNQLELMRENSEACCTSPLELDTARLVGNENVRVDVLCLVLLSGSTRCETGHTQLHPIRT
jgi:hypothetical protein